MRELDSASQDYPECVDLLNFHKVILEILLSESDSPTRGMKEALSDENVSSLLKKAVASRRPMSSFIDAAIFDLDNVASVAKRVTEQLILKDPQMKSELEVFQDALQQGDVNPQEAMKAILGQEALWFQNLGDKFAIDPSLMLFIFDTPLRPFFEELARRVEKEVIETWWEPFCPVCGRNSTVARMRHGKRYMSCTYCGTQHLVDLFQCTNCGNKEPASLGFIAFRDHPEYELDYCEKCRHYVKVLNDDRLKGKIPQGLEDLLTRELDILAEGQHLGLKRA